MYQKIYIKLLRSIWGLYMKKIISALIVLVLVLSLNIGALAAAITPADSDLSFENGSRVQVNNLSIVNLHGTWYEMGRQYGALLPNELANVAALCEDVIAAGEYNAAKAESILSNQRVQMPYTIREFFRGMEETSGLTMNQLECANAVERIAGLPHCSFAATWDDYAAGDLVLGRNYDYGEVFQLLDHEVVITVFHPADGALPAATIGYSGEIYAVNGMNEAGIFMELNNGTFSSKLKSPNLRITGTTQLLSMLFEADSLELMDMYFNSTLNSSAYIINAADSETVHSYEWCTLGVQRGDGAEMDGVFASTNHYVSTGWGFDAPDEEASLQTSQRRANLLALCEANKGAITPEVMMDIIATRLEDGGAANDLTVYQIVAVPATRTLWLKMVEQTEWTAFDLGAFFAQ